MKIVYVLIAVIMPLAASATQKVCYGSTKDSSTRGAVMTIDVDTKQIVMKTIKGSEQSGAQDGYNGTYQSENTTTTARTGKVYLNYMGEYADQQDTIMVDQDLLKPGTTGLLQIRSRGEGYFNAVYVCKDPH